MNNIYSKNENSTTINFVQNKDNLTATFDVFLMRNDLDNAILFKDHPAFRSGQPINKLFDYDNQTKRIIAKDHNKKAITQKDENGKPILNDRGRPIYVYENVNIYNNDGLVYNRELPEGKSYYTGEVSEENVNVKYSNERKMYNDDKKHLNIPNTVNELVEMSQILLELRWWNRITPPRFYNTSNDLYSENDIKNIVVEGCNLYYKKYLGDDIVDENEKVIGNTKWISSYQDDIEYVKKQLNDEVEKQSFINKMNTGTFYKPKFEEHMGTHVFPHDYHFIEKVIVPDSAKLITIGDIHSSFHSFIRILNNLKANDLINNNFELLDDNYMIFTGDFIERGFYSVELIVTILKLKIINKDKVIIVNGNHEDDFTDGFDNEITTDIQNTSLNTLMRKFLYYLPSVVYVKNKNEYLQFSHGVFSAQKQAIYTVNRFIDDQSDKKYYRFVESTIEISDGFKIAYSNIYANPELYDKDLDQPNFIPLYTIYAHFVPQNTKYVLDKIPKLKGIIRGHNDNRNLLFMPNNDKINKADILSIDIDAFTKKYTVDNTKNSIDANAIIALTKLFDTDNETITTKALFDKFIDINPDNLEQAQKTNLLSVFDDPNTSYVNFRMPIYDSYKTKNTYNEYILPLYTLSTCIQARSQIFDCYSIVTFNSSNDVSDIPAQADPVNDATLVYPITFHCNTVDFSKEKLKCGFFKDDHHNTYIGTCNEGLLSDMKIFYPVNYQFECDKKDDKGNYDCKK